MSFQTLTPYQREAVLDEMAERALTGTLFVWSSKKGQRLEVPRLSRAKAVAELMRAGNQAMAELLNGCFSVYQGETPARLNKASVQLKARLRQHAEAILLSTNEAPFSYSWGEFLPELREASNTLGEAA